MQALFAEGMNISVGIIRKYICKVYIGIPCLTAFGVCVWAWRGRGRCVCVCVCMNICLCV